MISRRRFAFPIFGLFFAAQAFAQGGTAAPAGIEVETPATVPKWGMFEAKITGLPEDTKGVAASFSLQDAGMANTVEGFRDGDQWRVRFMPSSQGKYEYAITGNEGGGWEYHGEFEVTEPEPGMHGPVRVEKEYHFAHADGTPFYPVGTTCYAWLNQPEPIRKQTVETLSKGYFNKIRFCIFPKHYVFNEKEPDVYPFLLKEGSEKEFDWDYTRPNPAYFARIDEAVETLGKLGIEADLILFHPYDKWGFSNMPAEANDFYLTYMAARYSAYANV